MTFKKNKLLSLLLAFVLAVSVFPASAFAVEMCMDDCGSSELVYEINSDTEVVELVTSGTVGESNVCWVLDTETGRLVISGSGGCETFTSAEDQPWAHLRGEIREVRFNNMDALSIENLAYWFEGCTALTVAEIPYTTLMIGNRAFAYCPSLEELLIYYYDADDFHIASDAFVVATKTNMRVSLISEQQLASHKIIAYGWDTCNRAVQFFDIYSVLPLPDCGIGGCTCESGCDWYYDYTPIDANEHQNWVRCTDCDGHFDVGIRSHTFGTDGYCTDCGYYGGTGGSDDDDDEPDYPVVDTCYHYYTSTTWSGCDWYEYCDNCDELVDYGTTHGTYTYGDWEYYTASQHRRTKTCDDCGEGSYSYGYHSTTTEYSKHSSTQHTTGSYCSTCESYIGSTTKESHSFTYGSWTNYDGTQHRRTKTCSYCGYSIYEYASHSITNGAWTSVSATQHQRTVLCSTCSYSAVEAAAHTITSTAWESISATQHSRTNSCSCGYSTTEKASHTLTYGAWSIYSETQHRRKESCACGYSTYGYGSHADGDSDYYCDSCSYEMTRFSVTVPANLMLTVAKNGKVYAPSNAAIVNNSTGAVAVKSITITVANGWTLVPYSYNMAQAKVDSKQIGFTVNGTATTKSGNSETLNLSSGWQIAKGESLALDYHAVVSATSKAIDQQVLTIVFVVDWAK